MKKTVTLLLTLILVIAMGTSVAAASLTDVVTALERAKVPDVYISQAESYFTANPITSAQADTLIANINAAAAVSAGETNLEKLTQTQVSKIMVNVTAAANAVNLKASLNRAAGVEGTRSNDNDVVAVYDASGKLVIAVSEAKAVKQTGTDTTLILFGGVAILLAAVLAMTRKVRQNSIG